MTVSPIKNKAPAAPDTVRWIEHADELDRWLSTAAEGQPLALDTEFERVSTFYPIPGLVQLGLGTELRLVDPEVAEASAVFRALLTDPAVPKLLYAMSEDLELFRHWLGVHLQGVLDLQLGAALAGAGFSVGYARMVEMLFGEKLDKSATRSDWLARPLSEAQQRYALDDIRFLEPMYHWVCEVLRQRGLETALQEESERFARDLREQENPDTHYLRLRGGWALSPAQQAVLKELVRWRELECRRQDVPRNRVVADAALLEVAQRLPTSPQELRQLETLPAGAVRRYGDILLTLVRETGVAGEGLELIPRPLERDRQDDYKKLRKIFRKQAEAFDIPIELLAPKKRLEELMRRRDLAHSPFFQGWRAKLLSPVRQEIEDILSL